MAARAAALGESESAEVAGAKALQATIEAALAPMQRTLADLARRVEELERRPQAAALIAASAAAAPRALMRSYPSLDAGGPPEIRMPARSHHSLDVAAIERDTSIVVDDALNGRSRRRRLVLALVFLFVALFGVLGYAVARSYAPH
jgi:hypothetical protein